MFRTEHPKPQFQRNNWLNLNGEWAFEIDNEKSGQAKGYYDDNYTFSSVINVPFCPESKLSGLEHTDYINAVWYKKVFSVPDEWKNGRIFINFGAVDYTCTLYINGKKVGIHKGGYTSFTFEITDFLCDGDNSVVVYAEDDTRNKLIPSGKQSMEYASKGCYYTRTTGIWQTVWLEYTPKEYVKSIQIDPCVKTSTVDISAEVCGNADLKVCAKYNGKTVGMVETNVKGDTVGFTLPLSETHLWELGNGRLYDLEITYGKDIIKSYFGLREVAIDGYKFLLNGKSVFQRLVLDQGFYPDGIYTAPDDKSLLNDIKISMDMGFNGARLHQKVFEERYLYYCDKMGYMVWGEFPDWGLDCKDPMTLYSVLPQWTEEVKRDYNHPSIVLWCPRNETQSGQYNDAIETIYNVTKALDKTRPCIDASGWFHVKTDIYDLHDYEQNPEIFKAKYDKLLTDNELWEHNHTKDIQKYNNEPIIMSEYGGIAWTEDKNGWGYGNGPASKKELMERLEGLTDAVLDNERFCGFCYTQLTDVEQEQNGLYTYDRKPKFDVSEINRIMSKKAKIEEDK